MNSNNGRSTLTELRTLARTIGREAWRALLGRQFNGDRHLYEVLGYKKTLTYDDYRAKFERQDIAERIVSAAPSTTWKNAPEVTEDGDDETETAFEMAFNSLVKRLRLWHYLERVDTLSGIGRFGVLLIGTKGAEPLSEEMPKLNGPDDVIYLAAYSEEHVEIKAYDTNPRSERFGRPLIYTINLASDLPNVPTKNQQDVHWTRVIHVSEGLLEDEVFGRPRLKGVYNRLDDLEKVVGGSAEMFWQGAYRGPVVKALEGFSLPEGEDGQKLQDEIDEYVHGLRRFMRLQGMEADFPVGQSPTPKEIFDILISLIAGEVGIPQRILLGSERGDLASSQDEANWAGHIRERQNTYAEPMILRPFIDRLIEHRALPRPAQPYTVVWPNLFELTELEKADVMAKKAAAVATYANSMGPELVMPPEEFRTEVLELKAEPENGFPTDDDDDLDEDDPQVRAQFRAGRRGR